MGVKIETSSHADASADLVTAWIDAEAEPEGIEVEMALWVPKGVSIEAGLGRLREVFETLVECATQEEQP